MVLFRFIILLISFAIKFFFFSWCVRFLWISWTSGQAQNLQLQLIIWLQLTITTLGLVHLPPWLCCSSNLNSSSPSQPISKLKDVNLAPLAVSALLPEGAPTASNQQQQVAPLADWEKLTALVGGSVNLVVMVLQSSECQVFHLSKEALLTPNVTVLWICKMERLWSKNLSSHVMDVPMVWAHNTFLIDLM